MAAARAPTSVRVMAIIDVWDTLTGGMDNLLQGGVGSFLGVAGAYAIARSTFKRELERDRRLAREAAGVSAAGHLITAIGELQSRLELLIGPMPPDQLEHVLAEARLKAEAVALLCQRDAVLLPDQLEDDLSVFGLRLPQLFRRDLAGAEAYMSANTEAMHKLMMLRRYRRDPLRDYYSAARVHPLRRLLRR